MMIKIIKILKNDKFCSLIFILNILFIIALFAYCSQNCCFWNDDYGYSIYTLNESMFDCLNFNFMHGAGYIGMFLSKFFCFGLPNLLGIHPNDFIGLPHGIIRGVFTAIILFVISKFSVVHFKSVPVRVSILLLLTSYFVWVSYSSWIYYVNYNYYRYCFSLIFASYFLYYIYRHTYLKPMKRKNWITLILASISGFYISCAVETEIFTILMLGFMCICYSLLVRNKSLKLNLDINFYLPFCFCVLAAVLFLITKDFLVVSSARGMSSIHLTLELFSKYIPLYLECCFVNLSGYWIICAILFFTSLVFAYKRQEYKKLIFPIFLHVSILVVMFSLILCDETTRISEINFLSEHPEIYVIPNTSTFYLLHDNVQFLYKMLLIFPLLIYFSYSLKSLNDICRLKNINIKYFLFVLYIAIYCLSVFGLFYLYKNKDMSLAEMVKEKKTRQYIAEKLLRFYYLRNEVPYLPIKYLREDSPENLSNVMKKTEYGKYCYNDSIVTTSQYPLVYKDKKSVDIGYCFSDDAIERYVSLGGVFTEEELKTLKFSNLFDEEFVLNNSL